MRRLILALALFLVPAGVDVAPAGESGKSATLYKNPQCGCCEDYAGYLHDNGFEVAVKPTYDLSVMRRADGTSKVYAVG